MDNISESIPELVDKRFRFKDRNKSREVQKAIAYLCRKGYPLEEVLLKLKDPE